ncbi:hypothetical protein M407DRAFT_44825, partial [Tulasnella calospora MUT 4182]
PIRAPWTLEKLRQERAIAIGAALDHSSVKAYNSHLQSYLTFCKSHNFPVQPTPDTLSFYTVYMCHHIKPTSVDSYLSGICSSLEPYYPEVRKLRKHPLVSRTLTGMKKLRGTAAHRKSPLTDPHLRTFLSRYGGDNASHDDILFLAIIFVGFHGLMRLGELTWPDRRETRSWRKVIMRRSVRFPSPTAFSFLLPYHKADRLYQGNMRRLHPNILVAMGRWASSAFQIYIRKNPVLLHSLI